MTEPTTDQRVVLHVGVPSAGTSLVASSLLKNRKGLLEAGVLHPGTKDRMRLGAVDVLGSHRDHALARSEVRGSWDDLARRARQHPGTTVLGHELLAAASPRQVTAAMTMLRGLQVHVVVTARDPARQLVAEWQESVRHGSGATFEEFRAGALDESSDAAPARWFRARQDLPDVLERWAAAVRREHVHVVTCPAPGSRGTLLWQRFADVVGFDPTRCRPVGPGGAQVGLGADEVDLLRRVNLVAGERVGPAVRDDYARGLLRLDAVGPVVPESLHDDLRVTAERWVKEIDRAGYRVHGSLDDLLPVRPTGVEEQRRSLDPRAQRDAAVGATAALLAELEDTRAALGDERRDNDRLRRRRKRLRRRLREATAD